ncbi:hypothetical protein [Streptomyces sviceus]|uniref:hypothetical protein n=1 Tax=Streptomyces sviceus TaxID=285530 RepID=UPI0036B50168
MSSETIGRSSAARSSRVRGTGGPACHRGPVQFQGVGDVGDGLRHVGHPARGRRSEPPYPGGS